MSMTHPVFRLALGAGCVGAALCLAGYAMPSERPQLYHSYLTAWLFWWSLSAGSLAILLIFHLTGGAWGLAVRNILSAASKTQVLSWLLFLPLLPGLTELFPWLQGGPERPHGVYVARWYLNPGFFAIRMGISFAYWFVLSRVLAHEEQETPPWIQRYAGAALALWGLTVTFSGIDWIMSLAPGWCSTAFGLIFLVAQALSAYAFALVLLRPLAAAAGLEGRFSRKALLDLGSLLLALTLTWAYVQFFEYLISWDGNLPNEASFFLPRGAGGWRWVTGVLMAGQFLIPFYLMLFRFFKLRLGWLATVALLSLCCRWVGTYWWVMPSFHPGFAPHWLDLATGVGVGGFWFAGFLFHLGRRPLFPVDAPGWEEVVAA